MEFQNPVFLILISLFLSAHHVSSQRSTYIVHMDKSSMPKPFSSHHSWYSSLLNSANSLSLSSHQKSQPKLLYTYNHAFHGFAAVMSRDELQVLKNSGGFIAAYPDDIVFPDTTHSTKFLSLNTAAGIWPASQYGKDVIIGVIDTGIWPESPSFHDEGMTAVPAGWKGICQEGQEFNSSLCNKKLIGARYFNEGVRAADPSVEISMNSARDEDGHGTHVASIAAGNYVGGVSFFGYAAGTARGVAPRARIAAYKTLWSGSYESDTLAGIDQAVADGVHIISISITYRRADLFANPIAAATFGAREMGVVVCMSAGNRGPSIATLRPGIPWAVVVASGTVDRWFAGTITLGNRKTITGWTMFPATASVRNLQLVYNHTLSPCNSTELLAQAPPSTIVICNITDQSVDFSSLMNFLSESKSPRAAIIISDDTSVLRSTSFPFPGAVITSTEAVEVIKYASNNVSPTATIVFQQTIIGTKPRAAPALSGSSSRGPGQSYQEILKPDIMAPGVLILAAYSPHGLGPRIGDIFLSTNYSLLSGTSMAAPHISGVAALLKAARPEWSPSAIQSAMMTTANQLDNTNQPIKDMAFDTYRVASPLGIGSGQVDPNKALDPGLIYDANPQDFVDLVCSMNFTREQTQTIIRSSYNCSRPSSDLNYPSFIALFNFDQRGMTFTKTFKRTVTNVGNGAAVYRVKLEPPENATVRIWPETLVFRKKYEKQRYSLSIHYRGDIDSPDRQGSVTWIEDSGKYAVRSPIVISPGVDNFG